MTTFAATHSQDTPKSTAVDTLTYNENTKELVVDWSGELWKYSGIDKATYDQVLAGLYKNAPAHASVGRSVSKVKRDFGPGTYLGRFGEVKFVKDTSRASTATFPLAATKSATTAEKVAAGSTNTTAPQRFSLTPSSTATKAGSDGDVPVSFTVTFVAGDGDLAEFTAQDATSVDEAIAELRRLADLLGVETKVKGVYVDYDGDDE